MSKKVHEIEVRLRRRRKSDALLSFRRQLSRPPMRLSGLTSSGSLTCCVRSSRSPAMSVSHSQFRQRIRMKDDTLTAMARQCALDTRRFASWQNNHSTSLGLSRAPHVALVRLFHTPSPYVIYGRASYSYLSHIPFPISTRRGSIAAVVSVSCWLPRTRIRFVRVIEALNGSLWS